ncbi:MAG: ABC transporter permease [Acidobacteriaceae bacterium]
MFGNMIAGIRALLRRNRRNAEIQAELQTFLDASVEEKMRRGMSREQALSAARAEIGSSETVRQKVWSAGWESTAESLWQDLRFALRQLRKNPGFALTAILILTLGIAASVAIFSFVDAALIRPLPYQSPSRLVVLYETNALGPRFHLSWFDYLDYQSRNSVFQSLDAYAAYGFMLRTPDGPKPADGARVTAGFFRTLGVTPTLGRDFRPTDSQLSAPKVALISYAAWQRRFAGRTVVLGQTVVLDDKPTIIIGVLPRDFHFAPAEPADFWTNERADGGCEKARACHNLLGVARLKPGVSFASALADVRNISFALAQQYPDDDHGRSAFMMPLNQVILGNIRPILLVLLAGAALLLLIAAVNVSSLLLVRSERRRREMAVRGALGASRTRLIRQFVTEGAVLAASAAVLGVCLAGVLIRLLPGFLPKDVLASMPYLRQVGLNVRVLAFAAFVALAAGFLFSLLPALRISLADLRASLSQDGRGASGTVWRRFGSNLVVVELTMAVVLLVGAGLLGKSFYHLLHVDTGLVTDHLATLHVAATSGAYSKIPDEINLARQLHVRLQALPGVQSVALTSDLPLGVGDGSSNFRIQGRAWPVEHNEVLIRDVSSTYFSTLKTRLLHGRYFVDDEDQSHPLVVVINRQMAKTYFPGENPLGLRIYIEGNQKSLMEIIGVIDDVQEGQLDDLAKPAMYRPFNQDPENDLAVVLRTGQDENSVLASATAAVHFIDPGLAVYDPITMSQRLHDSPSAALHRSSAWIVGGFAALALLLSVVGLYGVVAYSVSQRTREIGVRMALGAQRSSVYRLILREAGWLALAGIAAGLLCSLAATILMRKLLFQVHAWDLPTLTAVAVTLAAAALLASFLPARRAASVNPTEALHAE